MHHVSTNILTLSRYALILFPPPPTPIKDHYKPTRLPISTLPTPFNNNLTKKKAEKNGDSKERTSFP